MKTTYNRVAGMSAAQRTALTEQFDKAARIAGAEPIAVVGIGCRFPGDVRGPDEFWTLLTEGRDAVVEVPADRWDAEDYYDPDPMVPGRMPSKWGGFLSDIRGFDADFFGIMPREAEAMDPQQRILLEVAYEALQNAGYSPETVAGVKANVTVGVYYNEYQTSSAADPDAIDAYSATGNAHSVTVGRIAYLLGLRGPAVAVDTACSSSLVSLHLACQSLRSRESDLGVAGGVNVILRPETQLALGKWGMLSPRGKCNAFDVAADGFVRGEGAGVVVLKRLTDAVRDGDRVYAVIRGTATNQDGRSNGLTAPNAPAQREVITAALASGDVPASSVHYIETHGTGTALGDPIEFDAVSTVYGKGQAPCALGAVKSNFGHLEAAAGIAGFIKAVLTVHHGKIPPTLHFTDWNPAIDARSTRMFVPTETAPWPATETPRRAGVSAFGLGGTNAHIVIEQGPEPAPRAQAEPGSVTTLFVCGKTPERAQAWAGALADWLEGGVDAPLAPTAAALAGLRTHGELVGSVSARDRAGAIAGLRALESGSPAAGVTAPARTAVGTGVVFCYSGQGSQWAGMGRRLLAEEPAFAAAVDGLEADFVAQAGFSLRDTLASGDPISGIDRIQPVLVGVQLALTALWRSYGIEPEAVIGHSMGEVAAAVTAGALSTADGLKVIATRSRLMAQRLAGQGAMALLEADATVAEEFCRAQPDVGLAVYASPRHTVVAGPPDQIDAVIAAVSDRNLLARRVEVDVASHHRTVDPILEDLRTALADLSPRTPKIPLLSTAVDSSGIDGAGPLMDADYWVANLRNPVRFRQAVTTAAESYATFVEMSPHPLLTHSITDTLAQARPRGDVRVLGSLLRDEDETLVFHGNLALVVPDSATSAAEEAGPATVLPPPVWEHVPYWMESRSVGHGASGHPLLGNHVDVPTGGHLWQGEFGIDSLPWLGDHKVHGQPILPAAGFAEMVLAAGCEGFGVDPTGIAVGQLEVDQMLPVGQPVTVTTQLTVTPDDTAPTPPSGRVEIFSRTDTGDWRRHAVGVVSVMPTPTVPAPAPVTGTVVAPGEFYTALARTGAQHGPAFAALTRLVRADGGGSDADIVLPEGATAHRGFRIHPVLLDAALQGVAAAMPADTLAASAEATFLPVAIEQFAVLGPIGRAATCRATVRDIENSADKLGAFTLLDTTGTPIATASGVYLRRVQRRTVPLPLSQKIFDTEWVEAPLPADGAGVGTGTKAGAAAAGSWLVLAGDAESTLGRTVVKTLGADPQRHVVTADLADRSGIADAFAQTTADPALTPAGVVVVVDTDPFDDITAPDLTESAGNTAKDLVAAVSAIVRSIAAGWHGDPPRLWIVSDNGLPVTADQAGSPTVGALGGLVRTLAYEHPELRATLVDVDTATQPGVALADELAGDSRDDTVAWRGGHRHALRLRRATVSESIGGATGSDVPVTADGAYILTGGIGGLGLVMARWLTSAGAGRVVLNSRSAPNAEQQAIIADLATAAEVVHVAGDIADPGVADRLVQAAQSTGKSLRGVLHSAAVIDDELVTAISDTALDRVWAPKVTGALALHRATAQADLQWWVVFSSVAAMLGSPGQGAYSAANAFDDAFVSWRRSQGLPATAINWGQWAEVGVASTLSMDAIDPISPAEGIEGLEAVLTSDLARVGVVRLRLDRAAAAFPELTRIGYFAGLVDELQDLDDDSSWGGVDSLRSLSPAEVHQAVADRLRGRIAAIMGYVDASALAVDTPLTDLGMDSLMAVRIRNTVRGDFGVEPPVALLLRGASSADVATDLIGQLGLATETSSEPTSGLRERAQQRAAARQRAQRRRTGQRA